VIYNPFAVVVVPFPYTDNIEQSKRRPAVILSSALFNQQTGRSICAMITSSASPWPHDVPIADLKAAGLSQSCAVRMKLFTLENRYMLRQTGHLAPADHRSVTMALRTALDLTAP
jgi:mRNA interferase MazF